MKLSTRSRYGLRLMYELALNYGKGTVFLHEIAERQEMSEKYLSKLVIPLRAAKLVNSARGAHGGYTLARDPAKITAREIVEALEGDLCPVECVHNADVCQRVAFCPTRDIWTSLERGIHRILEGITLASIMKDNEGKDGSSPWGYSI